MPKRSKRNSSNITRLIELGIASPQVIAHRSLRIMNAGSHLSTRDQKEFTGMIVEKQIGFTQAWFAMCIELTLAQPRIMVAILSGRPDKLLEIFDSVLSKGLAPIHSKVTSNSRRLGKTKL